MAAPHACRRMPRFKPSHLIAPTWPLTLCRGSSSASEASPRNVLFGDRLKIAASVLFIPPNENEKATAGGNDVALPQSWIVYGTVGGFGFQGIQRRRGRRLRTRIGDEIFRAATGSLHALLPLLAGHGPVGKLLRLLGEATPRTSHQEPRHKQNRDPKCHGPASIESCGRSHPCRPQEDTAPIPAPACSWNASTKPGQR